MFPIQGKKKAVQIIMGMHGEPHGEESSEMDMGGDEALLAIAKDAIDAVHSKDEAALMHALKAFWDECEAHEASGEDEME
jgi:hypothetical protein